MNRSTPRYLQIYNELSAAIKNQHYCPGDLLPTEMELCEKYQTSRPTIAKALNMIAKDKLVRRRAGFGTQVLAPGKAALSAGLLIPRINETEIFQPICASLTETAGIDAMRIIRPTQLDASRSLKAKVELLADQFIDAKVNGVFFTPVEHISCQQDFNLNIIRRLRKRGIEVVLLDRDVYAWPRQTAYDLIGIDNIEAGFTMGGHLIGNGCQTLAFVSVPNPAMTIQMRRIGSRQALVHNGRMARELLDIDFIPDRPEQTAGKIMEREVDGVICANDATAAPLLRALLDLGADIPHHVQICGFDDVKYASLLAVPLSSYHQPCIDLGKIAAQVMLNRIRNPLSPAHRNTLRGRIIIRNSSCGPVKH